ncbi:Por secretion system C-terminal sorting domain-containing protein [Nonlabens sp. Hel1_33_55]|uniref:T9SS type A sorting domain-containing protein n=1 Tax=Nonlabens sp. Hel1_33_55 TaxID=1336802 RepID=UPI000875C388|nr:T9SS type A sorting domain-containing protein [Nonlabens sp. Hel1_33_55]SCY43806.1 Por secretion system C-terminal sorting domain-containing protein [Nonlabens sp. Hel1_33_55]
MKTIIFFICCFISIASFAQVTNEVEPRSWSMIQKSILEPEPFVLPKVDVKALQIEDKSSNADGINKALRIGADVPVDLNLFNSGAWTNLPNGDRIWKLNVKSNGAFFMRAIFDLYSLPKGGELFIYNNSKSDKIGPYTSNENQENGKLGTWVIQGDNFWLEYYEPQSVKGLGRLNIEKVTHGYVDLFKKRKLAAKLNESEDCNVDVLCDPDFNNNTSKSWNSTRDDFINSVARIIISTPSGTGGCSGTLMNNTSENAVPYFLTANHCIGFAANGDKRPDGIGAGFDAISTVAFGFQWFTNTPDCATTRDTNGPEQPINVLTGGQLKANNDDSDFALFQINQLPPAEWNLFYAGWNRSSTAIPTFQFGLHHPSTDIMKFARNDEAATKRTFNFNAANDQVWYVDNWEYGVTEQGSSGSSLINQNDQVIGVLSAGSAFCAGTTDNGGFDIYGRLDVGWNSGFNSAQRLRDWLDPSDTSAISMNGAYYATLNAEDTDAPEMAINIYPNPSTGLFTIDSDQPVSYKVFNLNGQLINESATSISNNTVDISNAAKGLYFIKLNTNDGQTITKKLIKQ